MKPNGLSSRMDRRGFLKTAGIGSLTVATLTQVPMRAWADDEELEFTFACLSRAVIAGETHQVNMAGDGKFNSAQVEGGGSFIEIKPLVNLIPKPLVAAGRWKAKRLLSWNSIGTFGVFAAGILRLEADLIQEIPGPLVVPAELEVVCNLGGAGLLTGEEEGFVLTVGGNSFKPSGGITFFSVRANEED